MIPRELLKKIRQIELRTNRLVTETLAGAFGFKPAKFERFGNCGEFAIIKRRAAVFIPSNSTELEFKPDDKCHD
jgi:hypothetical protein